MNYRRQLVRRTSVDNMARFYVPSEEVLFGGCLIKSVGAGQGFTGDANVPAWPETVSNIKSKFPNLKIVIPGHGKWGGVELLDYTIELFNKSVQP